MVPSPSTMLFTLCPPGHFLEAEIGITWCLVVRTMLHGQIPSFPSSERGTSFFYPSLSLSTPLIDSRVKMLSPVG